MLGVALRVTIFRDCLAFADAGIALAALRAALQTGRHAAGGAMQAPAERGAAVAGTGAIRVRAAAVAAGVVRGRTVRGARPPDAATGEGLGTECHAAFA